MKTKRNLFSLRSVLPAAVFCVTAFAQATTFTWDGTDNAPWSDAKWSDGVSSGINWVNGGGNDAVVNSGDVWSPIGISANSLTIGDGIGGGNSASARFATNNAFWGINTITINSDGYLAGSANTTSHLLTVNLNGGTIGGGDNGGDAAFYGIIALHGPVNVNGGANTSTISTTGGGVLLVGPTAGQPTEFNVADGAADVDLLVSGNLVHKTFGDSEKLLKTGAGTMVLSGTNAYQGGTTVNAGTLSIRGGSAMSSTGGVTINGGTLEVVQTLGGGGGDYNWYWGVDSTEIKTGGKLTINSHSHILNLTLSGGELGSTGVDPVHGYGGWVLDDSTTVTGGVTSIISAQEVNAANGGFNVTSGSTLDVTGTITGGSVTKSGDGTMTISGNSTYTGATLVSAGTLLVNGQLGNTAVTVGSNGTVGGSGSIAGSLHFEDGALLTVNLADPLSITGSVTFANFGFDDLINFDVETVAVGTYTLLSGSNFNFANVENFGLGNALTRLDGKLAYFDSGSLQVIVIPEPSSALLGGLGLLALLRRRR
jgi:fibronectin-binding autotransporter adhesin